MSKLEVRIERLEPMRVASALGFGSSPEGLAFEKMLAFVKAKGLTRPDGSFESYGFNNPNPSPGSPNYGYEIWVPVGPEVEGEGEVTIKQFEGGLYAVTRFQNLERIGQVWHELVAWREDSPYKCGHQQCLELLHNPLETDMAKYDFDLYLSIEE